VGWRHEDKDKGKGQRIKKKDKRKKKKGKNKNLLSNQSLPFLKGDLGGLIK
jgi:hypothetical protein